MSDINFTSGKNLLKRDISTGSATILAPTAVGSWGTKVSSYVVNHNLGYIPIVRVYYTPVAGGAIYPASGDRFGGGLGVPAPAIACMWEATTTTLTIYLECQSFVSPTGSRNIYWVIYKDQP
jgi:hypothetical protein